MASSTDVCILIPTLDEAETIGDIVTEFADQGYQNVLVMDGGSTDGTREIARDSGARVKTQTRSGKGQAVREALAMIDSRIIVLIDGDGTYRPAEVDRLLSPILEGRAQHVVGNRFGNLQDGAMTRLNRVGNRLINRVFRTIHGHDHVDILSGYRAFTRGSVSGLRLTEDGFGIEAQLSVECVKHDVPTEIVPITYQPRPTGSDPNLRPFRDGGVILLTLYRLAKTNNPLFYWGSLGVMSFMGSSLLGLYVVIEWLTLGIDHQVLATLAAFGFLFGGELLLFGVLADMIIALHRELLRNF